MVQRCLYCAYEGVLIFVHGHYQCQNCRSNIIPCCDGACPDEYLEVSPASTAAISPNVIEQETTTHVGNPVQYALFEGF
ncbi:MAG: hypothetical protein RLZZ370_1091 [Bacteroidota bacterium]|jgi:hypothetical protein